MFLAGFMFGVVFWHEFQYRQWKKATNEETKND